MATKSKAPAARDAGTDVGGLLDGLRKSKKFKQLATYSIQCLEKVIAPPRVGWEVYAKQALDLNAADDIAEIAQRFAADAEIFVLSITSLSALASVPKGLAKFTAGGTCNAIIQAISEHFKSIEFTSNSSEDVARLLGAMTLLQQLARADAGVFVSAGGTALLVNIACMTQPGKEQAGRKPIAGSALATVAPLVTAAAAALDRVSRSKPCLDLLTTDSAMLAALVKLAASNLNVAEIRSADLRKSFRRAASMARLASRMGGLSSPSGKAMGGGAPSTPKPDVSNAATAQAAAARDNNGHLEPAFRILDRIVRADAGRDAVLAVQATAVLPPILEQVQNGRAGASAGKALEGLIMRVLARLLGSDIGKLVSRLAGEEASVDLKERVLCARLLAGLMSDVDKREALLKDEGAAAAKLVGLLTTPPISLGDGVAPILQALSVAARSSSDAIVVLYDVGALDAVAHVLLDRMDEGQVVAEAVALLAAMVDCPEMVSSQAALTIDSGSSRYLSPGRHSLPGLVLRSLDMNSGNDAAVMSCLQYLEAVLLNDDEAAAGASALDAKSGSDCSKLVQAVVKAMAAHPDAVPVQLLASDVLNYIASSKAVVQSMVTAGLIPRLIANLMENDRSAGAGAGSDSPGKGATGMPKGLASPGAMDDEDDTAAAAALIGGDAKAAAALSAALVASTLHLTTSVCSLPPALVQAKEMGIIHAVLTGFSRHTADQQVYRAFREVVSALQIEEEEVRRALDVVDVAVSALQNLATKGEPAVADALRPVADYCASQGLPLRVAPPSSSQAGMAESLLENISLLEAVTVSPVFVAIIVACGGLPVLSRVIAVVAELRARDAKKATHRGTAAEKEASLVPLPVADQILSRACNTLAHVSRVAYELAGNSVEDDPAYEPVDYKEFGIEAQLYERDSLAIACRAMLAGAKPSYKLFAKDAITLLSWLASGHTHSDVRAHVDAIVGAQGIEASVAFLRAQQHNLDICASTAGALARISVSPKGAAAVAQRGASRQIIRMLRSTAALRSSQGDSLFLSFLRLLDTCARGGAEAAELLRKQGTVDALVECVDAGTEHDFFATEEESAAQAKTAMSLGSGSASTDSPVRKDIATATASLLSKLVGPELVRDTAAKLAALGKEAASQTGTGYNSRKAVKLPGYERACIMRPVILLGMLAETVDAGAVGTDVLEAGVMGCVHIAAAGLAVSKAHAADGSTPSNKSADDELAASVPACLRTIRQVLGVLIVKAPEAVTKALVAAVPVAVRAVEERPDCIQPGLACLATLCRNGFASAALPGASDGRGVAVVMDALRAAGDAFEDDRMRDALNTLAGVAARPDCRPLVIVAGGPVLAASLLSEMVTDSSGDAVAAAITLLSDCAVESKVASDLLNGNILDNLRTALQAHCGDPANSRVLQAVAAIVARLAVTKDVVSNKGGRGDEVRAILKRVVKALAGSPACLNNPRCSEAVLAAIATTCTAAGAVTEDAAVAAQTAVIDADGEQCIVMAMSSSAADDAVLAAGARALSSIGAASTAAKTLAEIDEYASRIPEWLEAGWDADAPEVIDLVAGMGDEMRSLGVNIVGVVNTSDLSSLPDLGDTYKEVLMTVWRAMHAVCRDEMVNARCPKGPGAAVGITCNKDLYSARADVLALGAQLAGRLTQIGASACEIEGADGAHAVTGEDAINVLATVFYAARDVTELRTVEAACRALGIAFAQYGGDAVAQCSSTGIIASLTILADNLEDSVNSAKAAVAAGDQVKGATLEELARMLHLVEGSIHALTGKTRAVLAGPAGAAASLLETSVALDVLDAAAHSKSTGAGADSSASPEEDSSDLQATVASYVKAAQAGGKGTADALYSILAAMAARVEEDCDGEAAQAAQGLAPASVIRGVHTYVRMIAALASKLKESTAKSSSGSATRVSALLKGTSALTAVAHTLGPKWRKAARSALAGSKPEKADTEAEDGGKGSDTVSSKAAWSAVGADAQPALQPLWDTLAALSVGSDVTQATPELGKEAAVSPLALNLQAMPPSDATVALAALRALACLSDMKAPDMLKAGSASPSNAVLTARVDRVSKLGSVGAYRALFAGLLSPGNEDSEDYCQEAVSLVAALLRIKGVDVNVLGLTKTSLLALQGAIRRFPGNQVLSAAGSVLLGALQSVYTEQSGAAFEGTSKRAVAAMSDLVKSSFARHMTEDGQMYYAKMDGEDSSWDPPEVVNKAMAELVSVDRMTRLLEDEAVQHVSPAVVEGMSASLQAHAHDPGVVGILAAALAKLAANPDNHATLLEKGVVGTVARVIRDEGHEGDARCSEAFINLVLPLSFDQEAVRADLGPAGVAPMVLRMAERFVDHRTTYIGTGMSWVPENVGDYGEQLASMEKSLEQGADKEERMKKAPRLAQCAAQTIANLACDNAAGADGSASTVDLLMEHGAVEKLSALMRAHPDNPRLLEDAICGLSNLAFVSDAIQTLIGRTCMDAVCATARRFNGDAYVFEMTLRAIGNLTRVDENILRAVGFGVIRGMVEGMAKHGDSPATLKLCADVMGNMVSIDPRRQDAQEAVKVLRETFAAAAKLGLQDKAASSASEEADIVARLASGEVDVKEAVCSLLYKDGGAKALVDTMVAHPSKPDLAASCLRALNYCVACPGLATVLVPALDLPSKVVLVCNANDTSPDVIKRTCRILGGMAGQEKLVPAVTAARAPSVLLAVLDTHRQSRELCFLAASVLTLLKGPGLATAVRELRSLDAISALFKQGVAEQDVEVYSVQLELLLALAQDAELAPAIGAKAGPGFMQLLGALTDARAPLGSDPDSLTLLSFTLSTVSSLVRHGADGSAPLLDSGLCKALHALIDIVLAAGKDQPSILLAKEARRAVLMSVQIMADAVRPPPAAGDDINSTLIALEPAQTVLNDASGLVLERVLTAYRSIPDASQPGTLLYDAATTKTCVAVLSDLVTIGHELSPGVSLELEFMAQGPVQPQATARAQAPAARPQVTHAGAAEGEVVAMVDKGAGPVEVWSGDKTRKARLALPSDRTRLIIAYKDGKEPGEAEVAVSSVRKVVLGNPAGVKKKFFGKSAKAERSLTLEAADGSVLLHAEFDDKGDKERQVAAVAVAALAGVVVETRTG